jgi:uncharacterized protein YraI
MMPPYVVPVILAGGAAAALYFLLKKPEGAADAASKAKGKGAAGDAAFPAELQPYYQRLLTSPTADPDATDVVAAKLTAYGFKAEAAALTMRAKQLRGGGAPSPTPGISPLPSNIPNLNPALGPLGSLASQFPGGLGTSPAQTPPAGPSGVPNFGPLLNQVDPSRLPNIPGMPPPSPGVATQAKITTADPAPSGDLIVRMGPGKANPQIGAADKNAAVQVVDWYGGMADGASWARIVFTGGRNPPITGYVKSRYLTPLDGNIPSDVTISGTFRTADMVGRSLQREIVGRGLYQKDIIGRQLQRDIIGRGLYQKDIIGRSLQRDIIGRQLQRDIIGGAAGIGGLVGPGGAAMVRAPSGMRVRSQPTSYGNVLTIAPTRAMVTVLETVRGPKAEVQSPGMGGWAKVNYRGLAGWVPLEWLSAG